MHKFSEIKQQLVTLLQSHADFFGVKVVPAFPSVSRPMPLEDKTVAVDVKTAEKINEIRFINGELAQVQRVTASFAVLVPYRFPSADAGIISDAIAACLFATPNLNCTAFRLQSVKPDAPLSAWRLLAEADLEDRFAALQPGAVVTINHTVVAYAQEVECQSVREQKQVGEFGLDASRPYLGSTQYTVKLTRFCTQNQLNCDLLALQDFTAAVEIGGMIKMYKDCNWIHVGETIGEDNRVDRILFTARSLETAPLQAEVQT